LAFHLQTRTAWELDAAARKAALVLPDWRIEVEFPWAAELHQDIDGIDLRLAPVWHLQAMASAEADFIYTTIVRFMPR
jgi:hypothetical protein